MLAALLLPLRLGFRDEKPGWGEVRWREKRRGADFVPTSLSLLLLLSRPMSRLIAKLLLPNQVCHCGFFEEREGSR